jgi:hypothetical protein
MTFYSGGQRLLQGETTEILEARRFQSLGLAHRLSAGRGDAAGKRQEKEEIVHPLPAQDRTGKAT